MVDIAAGLASVVAAFQACPTVTTCSIDPAQVTAPGCWVQFLSLSPDTLQGRAMDVQAWLFVTDSDGGAGPAAALGAMVADMEAHGITADDTIRAQSLQLPGNPAPLPALIVPLTVRIPA